jgi:hypothetical protein
MIMVGGETERVSRDLLKMTNNEKTLKRNVDSDGVRSITTSAPCALCRLRSVSPWNSCEPHLNASDPPLGTPIVPNSANLCVGCLRNTYVCSSHSELARLNVRSQYRHNRGYSETMFVWANSPRTLNI